MADMRYTRDHVWVRLEEDGTATVGLTDHAQDVLGEIVVVDLPDTGREVAEGEVCASVESEKAASEFFSPLAGTITEINELLTEDPGLVNTDPTGEAWLFRLELVDEADFETLMDEESYASFLETL